MRVHKPTYDHGFMAQLACIWEATSRKIGNVHRFADFADTSYLDFVLSGCAIQSTIDRHNTLPVGLAIWGAVNRTRDLVKPNTNLGILLLLVPLAKAVRFEFFEQSLEAGSFDCRADIQVVLDELTIRDAMHVFDCIRRTNPGGIGDAPEQDVREEPTVTLLEAMKLAADRDMVARQYANGFADVFDFGVPAFVDALARFGCVEAAIIDSQLRWLAAYPDSLIARKNGTAIAEDVQKRAAEVLRLGGIATTEGRAAGVALDKHLRSDGNKLNPGTTADLITACLFVALRENKVTPSAPFRWDVPDWL
jgi:triphosphoribosyl-dephospho-CoA synthase